MEKKKNKQTNLRCPTLIFYSLFYPITLEGRRGTTDEFATTPFHLDLFSAALVELAKSIPVHSLILSSHVNISASETMREKNKQTKKNCSLTVH